MVIPRAAYTLSKAAGALFVQLLSDQILPDELQVITFHPGTVFGAGWEEMGATKDLLPFDEGKSASVRS
jgi:nucleoside-diphosphate-sugar epimerase